jgi:hypothetical protein
MGVAYSMHMRDAKCIHNFGRKAWREGITWEILVHMGG